MTATGQTWKFRGDVLKTELSTPPEIDILQYGLHDSGNAERISALYGRDMRYCTPWKKWLLWDGQRWTIDPSQRARRWAKLAMATFIRQAIECGNEDVAKFARSSLNAKRIEYALSLAQPELTVGPEDLDQHAWFLNFDNCTIDLRDGQTHNHTREDLLTKLIPVSYDPQAQCPRWVELLRRMMKGDDNMVRYLQLAFGYCLTGSTREKAVFILFGPSGTGKTTLLTGFREAVGDDYSVLIQISSLMVGRDSNAVTSDLADLCGARFAMSSEPEQGQKLSPSKLKRLTQGMGKIKTRRLFENPFAFQESHHLWIDCNERPAIPGADYATFCRLHAIPCLVVVPDDEKDNELIGALRDERAGILSWAVAGANEWYRSGLPRPKPVVQATEAWREECDQIQQFLRARCMLGDTCRVPAEKLYKAYRLWIDECKDEALSMTAFGLRLSQEFEKKHGNRGTWYLGIGLRNVMGSDEFSGETDNSS
jgi:putative DNA primase/helicase